MCARMCVPMAQAFACVCVCVCTRVCADGSGICVHMCADGSSICMCVCVLVCACVWLGRAVLVYVDGGGRDLLTKVTNTPCTVISEMEKGQKKRIETNHIPSKSGTTVVNISVCSLFCCCPHFC